MTSAADVPSRNPSEPLPSPPPSSIPTGGSRDLRACLGNWTAEQREFVQAWQERAYRGVGEAMGWGSDPLQAFARLTSPVMPLEHVSLEKFKQQYDTSQFTPEQLARFEQSIPIIYEKYVSLPLPTDYENPNSYRIMAMTFDAVLDAFISGGRTFDLLPLLATLPTGDANAQLLTDKETDAPIIFFEQGLFDYFHQFTLMLSWALPPLTPVQLSYDAELRSLPSTYPISPRASEAFRQILSTYVLSGSLSADPSLVSECTANGYFSKPILASMERFVMAHELSHIRLGHLNGPLSDPKTAREQEFAADAAGADLVVDVAHHQNGPWSLGFWACDLALTALDYLERALGLFAFAPAGAAWVSKTHPPAIDRRTRLRERMLEMSPEPPAEGIDAAKNLLALSDALLGDLWKTAWPMLSQEKVRKKLQPSPMWRRKIERDLSIKK